MSLILFQFKTMKPDDYQLILKNLQLHYQDFLKDSKDSELFNSKESMQIERDYKDTTQHFDNLLHTMEKGTYFLKHNALTDPSVYYW